MDKTMVQLDEMTVDDLEEQDCLLIWDESEKKTKKVTFATLIEFIEFMKGDL